MLNLHSTPPLRGSRWNIAELFGTENLKWCGYRPCKTFEDMITIHEGDAQHDEQTDGQTPYNGTGRAYA